MCIFIARSVAGGIWALPVRNLCLRAQKRHAICQKFLTCRVAHGAQARTLMALTHAFYSDSQSFLRVHEFNNEPEKFRYDQLLAALGHNAHGA